MVNLARRARLGLVVPLLVSALFVSGCSGDGDAPAPTSASSNGLGTGSGSASGATSSDWTAQPVWQGTAYTHHDPGRPAARYKLYPLQRVDGRVLLTVDVTMPGSASGATDEYSLSQFCYTASCVTMQSVSLIDTSGLRRFEPLQVKADVDSRYKIYGSINSRSARVGGTTYRYGVFFPDPGTSTVAVDLVNPGAVPGVPIVDGGQTAPGLVATAAGGEASPSAQPSISSGSGDTSLVTLPVTAPGPDAVSVIHPLIAPVVGGEITDYQGTVSLNADVLFAFNSAQLSAKAKTLIAQAVGTLTAKADPAKPVLVVGHTDNVGGDGFNLTLSKKRADSVGDALKSALSGRTIQTEGKGEKEPVVPNTTPDGKDDPANRALNRRVEIHYTPKPIATPTPTPGSSGSAAVATITAPSPVANLGPADVNPSQTTNLATAQIAPIVRDGGLALVRFTLTPSADYTLTNPFSGEGAITAPANIRLIDPKTKINYLVARDAGADGEQARPIRPVGTYAGFPAKANSVYNYFAYLAAPPTDVTSMTLDLAGLGKVTVPVTG